MHRRQQVKERLIALTPAKVLQARRHRTIMAEFAEANGLVYFGSVDQHGDDHHLVRGLTLSRTHRDSHYCIGTNGGYDITLLERVDTLVVPGKQPRTHRWIIMEFDLHTLRDIPHIFIGLHSHSAAFYTQLFTKFSTFAKVPLGRTGSYDTTFTDRFAVYTTPDQAIAAEQLITPEAAKLMAQHFGTLTAEIDDGCLYIYAEHRHVTEQLLGTILQNGLWLARHIDQSTSAQ